MSALWITGRYSNGVGSGVGVAVGSAVTCGRSVTSGMPASSAIGALADLAASVRPNSMKNTGTSATAKSASANTAGSRLLRRLRDLPRRRAFVAGAFWPLRGFCCLRFINHSSPS